jgi:uncharacterized protein (DUF1697 family)
MYAAFLRGVNLAGKRKLAMADLRAMLAAIGYTEGQSLLNSGNVVFRCRARSSAEVERTLEREIETRLGLPTHVHVRTAAELASVLAENPFPAEAKQDPSHLLVLFLKEAPGAQGLAALRAAIPGRERVGVHGRHAYLVYPDGIGRSRLTNALLDKHLGGGGTARNWNTVVKLAAMAT